MTSCPSDEAIGLLRILTHTLAPKGSECPLFVSERSVVFIRHFLVHFHLHQQPPYILLSSLLYSLWFRNIPQCRSHVLEEKEHASWTFVTVLIQRLGSRSHSLINDILQARIISRLYHPCYDTKSISHRGSESWPQAICSFPAHVRTNSILLLTQTRSYRDIHNLSFRAVWGI